MSDYTQNFPLNPSIGRGNPYGMRSSKRLKESSVEEVEMLVCEMDEEDLKGS
jgi:hypothetical protein